MKEWLPFSRRPNLSSAESCRSSAGFFTPLELPADTRLEPPQAEMYGWPYSLDFAEQLAKTFDDFFRATLEPLMIIPGPITEVSIHDFDEKHSHPIFGGRYALNFLHFARIALVRGNKQKAAEFARTAIEICPEWASSLLEHLKEILAEASP